MKLDQWMNDNGVTNKAMADKCGERHGETVRRWRKELVIPRKRQIKIIEAITDKAVCAADFYASDDSESQVISTA